MVNKVRKVGQKEVGDVEWDVNNDPFLDRNLEGIGCQYTRQWKLQIFHESTVVAAADSSWGQQIFSVSDQSFRVGVDEDVLWGPNVPGLVLRTYPHSKFGGTRFAGNVDRFSSIDRTVEGGRPRIRTHHTSQVIDAASPAGISGQGSGDSKARELFDELLKSWRTSTKLYSSAMDIILDRSYQRIIGMGKEALPFIFIELVKAPGPWNWALQSITGEDPAKGSESRKVTRERWVHWAKVHGYLPE